MYLPPKPRKLRKPSTQTLVAFYQTIDSDLLLFLRKEDIGSIAFRQMTPKVIPMFPNKRDEWLEKYSTDRIRVAVEVQIIEQILFQRQVLDQKVKS